MRVKSQHYLQPTVVDAHSVIIEDNFGHILFIAVETDAHTIVTAQAGDPNFQSLLNALGLDKTTLVQEIKPKSIEEMKYLF